MESHEMPTPCQKCGEWFELNEGRGSRRWYPNTVICSDCGEEQQEEIEREEEIKELQDTIADLEDHVQDLEHATDVTDMEIAKLQKDIRQAERIIEETNVEIKLARERLAELKKLQ